ncbi:radical SAM protein with 4Fe4S-binding SPASM domain [Sporomusaceae bacterium BoRhaA]|uniref:radical SAM/SPASM domain-containing protein n=1 Tax=Pelorhabdus rhamnosifermentans TaxID=2772457 RepID=UPI001C061E91|nr:radical SAM/SPASM domain-containing protein [Pelorhabdus rhamnosifermentans]MBU2703215.1 radical SAM protein with 4Fe4S-binding SPASM domain [Pelorhabdus rhamnosifermentans]
MQAKVAPKFSMKSRAKLEAIIPLRTPFLVYVDPASVCNFQCEFCASGDREAIRKNGHGRGIMDYELFKKIVDDMSAFKDKIKVIRLFKEGEPLMNPRLPEMIRYAKKSGIFESIDFTTNGSLLNPQKNLEIIEAGLDSITISVEAMSSDKYLMIAKANINFDEYVANIKHFYNNKKKCIIYIKILKNYLDDGEEDLFYKTFSNIADQVFVERIVPNWPEYDMSKFNKNFDLNLYGKEIVKKEVCPHIFYSLAINVTGSVSACCTDWQQNLIVGDINKETLNDIWHGKALYELRKLHLQKKKQQHKTCRSCGAIDYCAPDNIDYFAEELLKKLADCGRKNI